MAQISVFVLSFIPLFILWPACYFPLLQFSLGGVVAPLLNAADEAHLTCIIITPRSIKNPVPAQLLCQISPSRLVVPCVSRNLVEVLVSNPSFLGSSVINSRVFSPVFSSCVSSPASWGEASLSFTLQQAFRLFFLERNLWTDWQKVIWKPFLCCSLCFCHCGTTFT